MGHSGVTIIKTKTGGKSIGIMTFIAPVELLRTVDLLIPRSGDVVV